MTDLVEHSAYLSERGQASLSTIDNGVAGYHNARDCANKNQDFSSKRHTQCQIYELAFTVVIFENWSYFEEIMFGKSWQFWRIPIFITLDNVKRIPGNALNLPRTFPTKEVTGHNLHAHEWVALVCIWRQGWVNYVENSPFMHSYPF